MSSHCTMRRSRHAPHAVGVAAIADTVIEQSEGASSAQAARGACLLRYRRGFTLVELLVVITIIAILIGLLAPVVAIALGRGREGQILTEMGELDSAMKAYKEKYGSYPPSDLSNLTSTSSTQYIALAQHLSKAFPRCNVANEITAINNFGMTTPAQALTFFLNGYSSNPEQPVSGLTASPPATQQAPLFPFDTSRFKSPTGGTWAGPPQVPVYCPAATPGVPYVYFAAQNYATHFNATTVPGIATGTGQGYCRPYFIDNPPTGAQGATLYCNPSSFQIISAGLDSDYGGTSTATAIYYPSGTNAAPGDKDNLTNFSSRNLGDASQQ